MYKTKAHSEQEERCKKILKQNKEMKETIQNCKKTSTNKHKQEECDMLSGLLAGVDDLLKK